MVGLHLYRPTRDWQTSVNLQKESKTADTSLPKRSVNPHEALTELCLLLEEYAPAWYTDEQRGRALAERQLPAGALLELVALLEEYAPLGTRKNSAIGLWLHCKSWGFLTNKDGLHHRSPGHRGHISRENLA